MNILVTGGAGFIGSNLTEVLLKKGYRVTVIDNFNNYYDPQFKRDNIRRFLKNKNFILQEGDIIDSFFLHKVFKKNNFDKVIHLAACVGVRNSIEYQDMYRKNNVSGTQNILDMVGAHKIKHFLFASSSSVYGNNSLMPFEENKVIDSKLSPYAQTKKDGELLCFKHHQKFNTNITIFRFFTVYGPKGRPDMAPYIFTESVFKEKKISIFGDGTAKRDFTYIDDLIRGIFLGLKKEFSYEIFNLGNSLPIEIKSFVRKIEEITGKKADIEYERRFLPEMRNTYASINKAKKLLGYKPRVDIDKGLSIFVKWYKENRLLKNNLSL